MAADVERRKVLQAGLTACACLATARLAYAKPAATVIGNRPEAATQHFLKSMNCSQAILETYGPNLGLNAGTARRLTTGFAGGMGMGHECGAVTGAYLALGLAFGPKEKAVFAKMEKFNKEFRARHRELGCSQLLGVDMGTPEGVKEAGKKGLFKTACPVFVRSAGEILEKLLA